MSQSANAAKPWFTLLITLGLAMGISLFIFDSAAGFFEPRNVGWDQSWYLYTGKLLLSGVRPYSDRLMEVNPPLIVWFSSLPILASRLLHLSPLFTFKLFLWGMFVVSISWCVRILLARGGSILPNQLPFLTLALAIIVSRSDPASFGQREQIGLSLMLPYLVAVATGAINKLGRGECVALGMTAAIGVGMKPQHLFTILCLELALALWTRSLKRIFRPEVLAILLTGGLYLLLIRLLTPDYITRILPLLTDTFWAYGSFSTVGVALGEGRSKMLIMLATLIIWAIARRKLNIPVTSALLVACSFGASIASDLQHTGWYYQAFPERALLYLATLWLAADIFWAWFPAQFHGLRIPRWIWIVALCTATLCLLRLGRLVNLSKAQRPKTTLAEDFRRLPEQTTVLVLTTELHDYLQVMVDRNMTWGSRFVHLWMLPAIVVNELGPDRPRPFKALTPQRVVELANLQRSETAEDLDRWKPSVVYVQRCSIADPCQGIEGRNFDMLGWFRQSPSFAAEWSGYHFAGTVDKYDRYLRNQ